MVERGCKYFDNNEVLHICLRWDKAWKYIEFGDMGLRPDAYWVYYISVAWYFGVIYFS